MDLEGLLREKKELEARRAELKSQVASMTSIVQSKEVRLKELKQDLDSLAECHANAKRNAEIARKESTVASKELQDVTQQVKALRLEVIQINAAVDAQLKDVQTKQSELTSRAASYKADSCRLADKVKDLEEQKRLLEVRTSLVNKAELDLSLKVRAFQSREDNLERDIASVDAQRSCLKRQEEACAISSELLRKVTLALEADKAEVVRRLRDVEAREAEVVEGKAINELAAKSLVAQKVGLVSAFDALEVEKMKFQTEKMKLAKMLRDKSITEAFETLSKELKSE